MTAVCGMFFLGCPVLLESTPVGEEKEAGVGEVNSELQASPRTTVAYQEERSGARRAAELPQIGLNITKSLLRAPEKNETLNEAALSAGVNP
jgi:outer membrane protein TolC